MACQEMLELVARLVAQNVPAVSSSEESNDTMVEFDKEYYRQLIKKLYDILFSTSKAFNPSAHVFNSNNDTVFEEILEKAEELKASGDLEGEERLTICLARLMEFHDNIPEGLKNCLRLLLLLSESANKKDSASETTDSEQKSGTNLSGSSLWDEAADSATNSGTVVTLFSRDVFEDNKPFNLKPPEFVRLSELFAKSPGMGLMSHGQLSESVFSERSDDDFQTHEDSLDYINLGYTRSYASFNASYPRCSSAANDTSVTESSDEEESPFNFHMERIIQNIKEDKLNNVLEWETLGVYNENIFDFNTIGLSEEGSAESHVERESLGVVISSLNKPCFWGSDVIQLLVGISSNAFIVTCNEHETEVKPGISLVGCSEKVFEAFASDIINMCKLICKLEWFSKKSLVYGNHDVLGSVLRAFKEGLQAYITVYKRSLLSTTIEGKVSLSTLKDLFHGMKQNLETVARLCGITLSAVDDFQIPLGSDLLKYVYQNSEAFFASDFYYILLLLFKHAVKPYLSYLQQWLFFGACEDPLDEFHIQENSLYTNAKDESYWLNCYKVTSESTEEFCPPFLQHLASDILICGKSLNLIKRCCPSYYSCCTELKAPDLQFGICEKEMSRIEKNNRLDAKLRFPAVFKKIDSARKVADMCSRITAKCPDLQEFLKIQKTSDDIITYIENCLHIHFNIVPEEIYELMYPRISSPIDKSSRCASMNDISSACENVEKDATTSAVVQELPTCLELAHFSSDADSIIKCIRPGMMDGDIFIKNIASEIKKTLFGHDSEPACEHKAEHISVLVSRTLTPLIKSQAAIVNRCTLDYFYIDLHLKDHFLALRSFFFLKDGLFFSSLTEQIFKAITKCLSPREVVNNARLSCILTEAIGNSMHQDSKFAENLSLTVKSELNYFPAYRVDILKHMSLFYKVDFPCNIVITEKQMELYYTILSCLMELQHILHLINESWRFFKKTDKDYFWEQSQQYKTLLMYRQEMEHFVMVSLTYFGEYVIQETWEEFHDDVDHAQDLEELRNAHMKYLNNIKDRLLLSQRYGEIRSCIRSILKSVLYFFVTISTCNWIKKEGSCSWEFSQFSNMLENFEKFQRNMRILYKVFTELQKDRSHLYLLTFLVSLNFNGFYEKYT